MPKDYFRIWVIIVIIIGAAVVISVPAFAIIRFYFAAKDFEPAHILVQTFADCMQAGYPVAESYPRQCRTPEGQTFVEDVHDVEVPVTNEVVSTTPAARGNIALKNCIISGCSSQVCADHEVMTTCEFRPEYACFSNLTCRRQQNGECGWDQTAILLQCLKEAEKISGAVPVY